jgi:hypothetical protein
MDFAINLDLHFIMHLSGDEASPKEKTFRPPTCQLRPERIIRAGFRQL